MEVGGGVGKGVLLGAQRLLLIPGEDRQELGVRGESGLLARPVVSLSS